MVAGNAPEKLKGEAGSPWYVTVAGLKTCFAVNCGMFMTLALPLDRDDDLVVLKTLGYTLGHAGPGAIPPAGAVSAALPPAARCQVRASTSLKTIQRHHGRNTRRCPPDLD